MVRKLVQSVVTILYFLVFQQLTSKSKKYIYMHWSVNHSLANCLEADMGLSGHIMGIFVCVFLGYFYDISKLFIGKFLDILLVFPDLIFDIVRVLLRYFWVFVGYFCGIFRIYCVFMFFGSMLG